MKFILVVGLVTLLMGLSKGGLGGPVPIALITPLLSQLLDIPVPQAVSVALPLLLIGDVFALRAYWQVWEMGFIKLMLPMAVIGVIAGTVLLASLPDEMLRPILGAFTLTVVIYKLLSDRISALAYEPRSWHGHVVGAAAGFGSALANAGAPAFTAYMLLQRVPPLIFIGTTTLFFAIVNILKLPGILAANLLDLHLLWSTLWSLPLIPVGVWLGHYITERSNPKVFEYLMIFSLLVASLSLLLTRPG